MCIHYKWVQISLQLLDITLVSRYNLLDSFLAGHLSKTDSYFQLVHLEFTQKNNPSQVVLKGFLETFL